MEIMTPKERVFETLKNLLRIVAEAGDLNTERERLKIALDRCVSWETELADKEAPNAQSKRAFTRRFAFDC